MYVKRIVVGQLFSSYWVSHHAIVHQIKKPRAFFKLFHELIEKVSLTYKKIDNVLCMIIYLVQTSRQMVV